MRISEYEDDELMEWGDDSAPDDELPLGVILDRCESCYMVRPVKPVEGKLRCRQCDRELGYK
jgi:hypothetical protein